MTYAYDAQARLATVTDKMGNAAGQNPLRQQLHDAYDGATRHQTTITAPDGRVRVPNTYDSQGRLASATYTSPTGSVTVTYSYDAAGNRTAVVTQ